MEHVRIEELVEFSVNKRVRKKLLGSEKIVAELVCYEPGQGTPVHYHPKQDEMFYIVEGNGKMFIGDDEVQIHPKNLLFVPAETRHGFTAANGSLLVILFFKAPASLLPPSA